MVAFDLGVAAEVFTLAYDREGRPLYDFTACSARGGRVATTTGFGVDRLAGAEALDTAHTIIVPGYRALGDPLPDPVAEGLRAAHERGARVTSICTGAFGLGRAGLLDGRRATTHWFLASWLQELYPAADIDPSALYVEDDDIYTSAGLSAGIDMCLHLVRSDFGERIGSAVARAMVASPHREGGQAQFIARPLGDSGDGRLGEVRAWALDNLDAQLDVATMAGRASMSPRNFARRFREETGQTPLRWVTAQRVLEARRLLESTDLPVEHVATHAGFGSAPSLRQHFRRSLATSPAAYRRAFRTR